MTKRRFGRREGRVIRKKVPHVARERARARARVMANMQIEERTPERRAGIHQRDTTDDQPSEPAS